MLTTFTPLPKIFKTLKSPLYSLEPHILVPLRYTIDPYILVPLRYTLGPYILVPLRYTLGPYILVPLRYIHANREPWLQAMTAAALSCHLINLGDSHHHL